MRRAAARAALVLALASPAPAAHAAEGQESVFQDDNLLLYRGDRVSDRTFDELRDLGVDRVRLSVPWRAIETAPGRFTHFGPWDHAVRAARARRMDVLFNVTGGAPLWATGRRNGRRVSRQYKPDPAAFERFVERLGRRYRTTVDAWSIWNEPNYGAFLQPQWERGRPASPRIYRGLVRAALRGLRRSGNGGDIVLLGETSPRGVEQRGTTTPMRPALFLRELFCLDLDLLAAAGCDFGGERLGVTGYAHHPYPIVSPPETPSPHPDDLRLADTLRLTTILDAAAGLGRIAPELPVWFTEFGWQTPPDPVRGVPLAVHAAWLARAERLTYADRRVVAHAQFQLRDDPPRRAYPRSSPRYWGTYQAGLRFANGRAKPAYDAYRLPFDGPERVAPGETLRLWGRVRPARGLGTPTVQLEHRAPGARAFRPVGDPIQVYDRGGAFDVEAPRRSGTWRFRWRGDASNAVAVLVE